MNRLVYLYVSNGAADVNSIPKWSPKNQSIDPFTHHFTNEGTCYLFQKLLEKKVFDHILVVIESNRSSGSVPMPRNMSMLVVPHMDCLKPYLQENDIIWARGGWKSWYPFLQEQHDNGRWLLYYRAASNRGKWEFWDIVLDDLITDFSQDAIGRFYYPFNKPINPKLFFPTNGIRKYDLCIGASHVHDKKGQWRMLAVLDAHEKRYRVKLRCILPGAMRNGVGTNRILEAFNSGKYNLVLPSMLPRPELCEVYNQSKLFVHCGGAGQNDRGPLEAMSCGTPIALANEQYHASFMHSTNTPFSFHITPDDPDIAAQQINYALNMVSEAWRASVKRIFEAENGVESVIVPQFERLFSLIAKTPHKNRQEMFDLLLKKA